MNIIKFLIFFTLFFNLLIANDELEELYKKASLFEKNNDYKKALEIYKQIALKEKNLNRTYFDEEKVLVKKISN